MSERAYLKLTDFLSQGFFPCENRTQYRDRYIFIRFLWIGRDGDDAYLLADLEGCELDIFFAFSCSTKLMKVLFPITSTCSL